jgi:hypothetical protein
LAIAIVITDIPTFLISSFGIVISVLYIFFQAFRPYHTHSDIEGELKMLIAWLNDDDEEGTRLKVMLADHKTATEEVGRRDNVTLLVGTILITSSFIILGNVAVNQNQPKGVFSLASVLLFVVWLIGLHETGKVTNQITYNHLKSIEGAITRKFQGSEDSPRYKFGTNLLICEKTEDQSTPWLRFRRMFWAFVLLLLSFSWMLISLSIENV